MAAIPVPGIGNFQSVFNEVLGPSVSDISQYTGLELTDDKKAFVDLGSRLKSYSMENLSYFSTVMLPYLISKDIKKFKSWQIRFDKSGPGKNPIGGTANRFTYSVTAREASTERLGNSVNFSLIELMTDEGRYRASMAMDRLVDSFVETIAMIALLEVNAPEKTVDPLFYRPGKIQTTEDVLRVMEMEKNETFLSIKSDTELRALIDIKKAKMALLNGNQQPTTLMFNAAKAGLWKFGNSRTGEPGRAGKDAEGMFFSAKTFDTISDLKVVGIPMFPTDAESGSSTLLSHLFTCGNVMMYNEKKFAQIDAGTRRVINIFSQEANGHVELGLYELIDNLPNFNAAGVLDPNYYNGLKEDMFTNPGAAGVFVRCATWFEVDVKYFDQAFLDDNVARAGGAGFWGVDITRDSLKTLVRTFKRLPFNILIIKPEMVSETSPLTLLYEGVQLGRTLLAFNSETAGINAKDETFYAQINRDIGAAITDYFKRCNTPNVHIEHAISGNGHEFVTQDSWNIFKAQGKNVLGFSLLLAIVPLANNKLDTKTGWIDMCGKFRKMDHAPEWVGSELFIKRWRLESLKSKSSIPYLACCADPTKRLPNRVLYWGSQHIGPMPENGEFETKNRGHYGSIERSGDKLAREYGNRVKLVQG